MVHRTEEEIHKRLKTAIEFKRTHKERTDSDIYTCAVAQACACEHTHKEGGRERETKQFNIYI